MNLLFAALLALTPITAEQAKKVYPAIDLSDLTDEQRGVFFDAAADVYNYAGCDANLARCLDPRVKDPHAIRMAALVHQLVKDGIPATVVSQLTEKYYFTFQPNQRVTLKADNCAIEGAGPITFVEFSDYQCPHCAVALGPLTQLVKKDRAGQVRLCSKYFPFSSHPRARIAALCAEYARSKGKFWEMNAALFAHQDSLEDDNLKTYAKEIGLDADEMLKQAYSGKFQGVIDAHVQEANGAKLSATPTFYLNGRMLILPAKPEYLLFSIQDEVEWTKNGGAWEKE